MSQPRKFEITDKRSGAALNVRVFTQSPRTEFAGVQEGLIHLRLLAQEADTPEANSEVRAFLAELLGLQTGQVEIVAGEHGRDKIISLYGISADQIEAILSSQ